MNVCATRFWPRALLIAAAMSLTACGALSGQAVEGQVLEVGTNKPIPGAIVVVRWRVSVSMLVDSQDACVHVDSAVTDENGRYRLPAWRKPSTVGPTALVSDASPLAVAYKTGYEEARYASNLVVYLRPSARERRDRLEYLVRISRTVGCHAAGESERNLLPLRKALYEEAQKLAQMWNEKRSIEELLYSMEVVVLGYEAAQERHLERLGVHK